MQNEITIKDSASIAELQKLKDGSNSIRLILEQRGVSCKAYIKKITNLIDKQITRERIQLLQDEQNKLRKGEASVFDPKIDAVVLRQG